MDGAALPVHGMMMRLVSDRGFTSLFSVSRLFPACQLLDRHGDHTKIDVTAAEGKLTRDIEREFGTCDLVSDVIGRYDDDRPSQLPKPVSFFAIPAPLVLVSPMMISVVFHGDLEMLPCNVQAHWLARIEHRPVDMAVDLSVGQAVPEEYQSRLALLRRQHVGLDQLQCGPASGLPEKYGALSMNSRKDDKTSRGYLPDDFDMAVMMASASMTSSSKDTCDDSCAQAWKGCNANTLPLIGTQASG